MLAVKRHILLIVALTVSLLVVAQNNTSSPFSCFGLGDINDNVPTTYRAMGSIGVGMRNHKVINPSQPASYTATDSLTFMFDLAADVMWTRYGDVAGTKNKANGNLEYITLQFPIYKRYIAFSAGILPFSSVGYDFTLTDSINSDYHFTKTYLGTGGITQIYAGLGFNLFDWVALLYCGDTAFAAFTPLTAFTFMLFVLLYFPCVATVTSIKREAGRGWAWFTVLHSLALAWIVAFLVYQIGSLVV